MIRVLSDSELAKIPVAILPKEHLPRSGDCHGCAAYRPAPQASGNLQIDPEITLPGPMPLEIGYFYNAASSVNGIYGYGRQASFGLTAQASGANPLVTLTRESGAQVSYLYDGTNYIAQTVGCLNSLTADNGNSLWKETRLDGVVTAYPKDTTGKICSVTYVQDPVGNTHTYLYSGNLLQNIQDGAGRLVTLSYSGGLLQSIQDWANRTTTFQYDTASAAPLNLLTTVTGPTGCQTEYSYATFTQSSGGVFSSKWLVSGITDPNGGVTSYNYDQQSRVTTRSVAGQGIYSYLYQASYFWSVDPTGAVTTQILDSNFQPIADENALGLVTSYTLNSNAQRLTAQNPLGAVSTNSYTGTGLLAAVQSPLDQRTTYSYDGYSNQTAVQTPDGAVWTGIYGYGGSAFDTTGAKHRLQVSIDPLGNRVTTGYTAQGLPSYVQDMLGFITSYNYNSFGDLISTQDALGNFWTITRDLAGNAIAQMNPLGAIWSQTFDLQNRPLVATDPLNNQTQYGYDSVGNRTVAITPLGFRTTWTYNIFDLPVTEQNALGYVYTSVYDSLGRKICDIDPLGNRSTTVWNAASQVVATQNPVGAVWTNIMDLNGRLVATQNPLGYFSTTVWNSANEQIAQVDALGNRSTAILDANGRVIANQNALGYLSTTVLDLAGRAIAQVDALGNRSTTVWDGRNLAVAQTNALGQTRTTIFNGNQAVIAQMDPGGYVTSTILDSAGRISARQDANGNLSSTVFSIADQPIAQINALSYRTSTAYDANSNPVQYTDPLSRVSTTVFDALDRQIASVTPLGYISTTNWDTAGRQASTQNAIGAIYTNIFDAASQQIVSVSPLGYRMTSVFDLAGQQIASQDSLGYLNSSVYNANGQLAASINPLNFRWTSLYDSASQNIASINPLGAIATQVIAANGWLSATQNELGFLTTVIRDATGRQICALDANGGRVTSIFSNRGLLAAEQDQLGALTSYTQDAVGNSILRVDARNWPTTYAIDALNRTSGQLYVDGTRVTNTWNAAGEQTTSQDSTGITSLVWDVNSRKTSVVYPTGVALTSTLDGVGNRLVLADPYGVTTYSWDLQSRLTNILNPQNEMTSISLDALDRESHRVLGNGMAVSHAFDGAGNETLLQNISAAGVALAVFTNSYSALGDRLSVIELDNTRVSFSYDASRQLINEQRSGANAYNTTYIYDGLGNRLQENSSGAITTRTFNAANAQLVSTPTSGPATTNSWDATGNLIGINIGGALTTQIWTPENYLASLSNPDGTSEQYTMDQAGLRRSLTAAGSTTQYVLDGENVLLESDNANVLQVRYTEYPELWGGLASQRRGSTTSFYGFDSQQSTRILVSIDGMITDSYSYKAFGVELQSGSGTVNTRRYVGKYGYRRERANANLARRRVVFAVSGQFNSRDSIKAIPYALYSYVHNMAVVRLDPSGKLTYDPTTNLFVWEAGICISPWLQNCCGGGNAKWRFLFSGQGGHAPCNGFLIQYNEKRYKAINCENRVAPAVDDLDFFEYWRIDQNAPLDAYTDRSGRPRAPYTHGLWTVKKQAKFYCDSDLTQQVLDQSGFEDPGGPDKCHNSAQALPCTSDIKRMQWFFTNKYKASDSGAIAGSGVWTCCCDPGVSITNWPKIPAGTPACAGCPQSKLPLFPWFGV